MDIYRLLIGIAIVIDDEVDDERASIYDLLTQINSRKIPYVTYKEIPEHDTICHFEGCSFLILDWKLTKTDSESEGVTIPDTLRKQSDLEKIEFLKALRDVYFGPIFIFTTEDKGSIIQILEDNDLYHRDVPNVILVRNKEELSGDNRLFEEVEQWLRTIPSVYVLKVWEREYQKAKKKLFQDFYKRSPFWPKVLWDTYKADGAGVASGVNLSRELGELISRNLYTRMSPFTFEQDILEVAVSREPNPEEVRCVLEGERFIKADQLNSDEVFTGDIYFGESQGTYLLNIRAQCDLVRENNPYLYCLKGRVVDEATLNTQEGIPFDAKNGEFREKKTHAIVSCIDEGKIIEFLFYDLKIKKWNSLKEKRIGRLLPPYITRIQQLYSLYFQRQGLPRTPGEAYPICDPEESPGA